MLDFHRKQAVAPRSKGLGSRRILVLMVLVVAVFALVWESRESADHRETVSRPLPSREALVGDLLNVGGPGNEPSVEADALFPGVRSDYLRDVRDDTVFRSAESDAWFHLLVLLEQTDPAKLKAASLGRVGYLQLDDQAAAYRGRIVSVEGIARKAKLIEAPENAYGIHRYYQLWLQPERSAPELLVLYVLELPKEFPLGDALDAEVSATGFFFKRWAYTAQDGIRTAPLVIARTIDWQSPPPTAAEGPVGEQFILAAIVSLVVAFSALAIVAARSRRFKRRANSVTIEIPVLDDTREAPSRDEGHSGA